MKKRKGMCVLKAVFAASENGLSSVQKKGCRMNGIRILHLFY